MSISEGQMRHDETSKVKSSEFLPLQHHQSFNQPMPFFWWNALQIALTQLFTPCACPAGVVAQCRCCSGSTGHGAFHRTSCGAGGPSRVVHSWFCSQIRAQGVWSLRSQRSQERPWPPVNQSFGGKFQIWTSGVKACLWMFIECVFFSQVLEELYNG